MTTAKKIGIWMDHSIAQIIEFTNNPNETKTISLKFTHEEKENSLNKGEKHMHIKEQHRQLEYYKKLGEVINNYEDVILFGPTDAKVELFNFLKADPRFAKIKIEIKQTDKLTENQQHNLVKKYFSKR